MMVQNADVKFLLSKVDSDMPKHLRTIGFKLDSVSTYSSVLPEKFGDATLFAIKH
jgi:hypothetical protein